MRTEARKRNLWRRKNEHHTEQQEVHQIDHNQREDRALIAQVRLILRNHPARKSEVESPCHTDYSIKPSTVWLHIHEKAEPAIDGNCQNAVEREKIRRQRDPKVGLVGNDMPTVTAYAKPAHPSAHQPNPKSMAQFVSKDINEDWTRETEKCDQPQNCTQ